MNILIRFPLNIDGETLAIGTANELSVALDVLQGRHDREVLEQLAPNLAEIVGGPAGFSLVLKSLEPADQVFLIRSLGSHLAEVLQSARYLRDILATISVVEVEQALVERLGRDGLRRLILSSGDLAEVLEWVYGECDQRLLDLLGQDYLRLVLTDAAGLSQVLTGLDEAGQMHLIGELGWEFLVESVDTGRDLAFLLRALPAFAGRELLDRIGRRRLVEVIGNAADWQFLCLRLEFDEANYLFELLGVSSSA